MSAQVGALQDGLFRPVRAFNLRARFGRGWLHPERRGGRGQGAASTLLPLYGVAHQARHKVMHLLGATKKRDKMKRPKPVAPVFDLERLLRTCLKEDRSRVARDNLDLVEYWPPSDKSCRPKCRRFQNDRDLGKNWEDIRACLLADLAQAALGPGQIPYRRGIDGSIDKKIREVALQRRWQPVHKTEEEEVEAEEGPARGTEGAGAAT